MLLPILGNLFKANFCRFGCQLMFEKKMPNLVMDFFGFFFFFFFCSDGSHFFSGNEVEQN